LAFFEISAFSVKMRQRQSTSKVAEVVLFR